MKALAALPLLALTGCPWMWGGRWEPWHEIVAEVTGSFTPGAIATVDVRLSEPYGDKPVRGDVVAYVGRTFTAQGRADDAGRVTLTVRLPNEDADVQVEVRSTTTFGTRSDTLVVPVRRPSPLFFALDRPLAQPGQAVHMRALAFRTDRTADAHRDVTFEIHDPQSNRVFRETAKTSEFGIAHATFKLADEVALGDYRATATCGPAIVERPFSVKRYTLPRFRTTIVTEKAFVLAGQAVRGTLQSTYVFGKPVAKAAIVLHAETRDGAIARQALVADELGRAEFTIDTVPDAKLLRLTAEVTDTAGHTEAAAHVVPIAAAPLLIHAVPTCGKIVHGADNELLVFVTAPDGGPAEAEVTVGETTAATNALGMARLTVQSAHVTVRARDGRGLRAARSFDFPSGGSVVLRPSHRAPKAGTRLDVEVQSPKNVTVTLRNERGLIAQATGNCSFALPPDADGRAVIEAGDASVLIWIRGTRRLDVRVQPESAVVRPGEENAVRFSVRDGDGRPVRAAIGVSILDDALLGLAEIDPDGELASFAIGGIAAGHAAKALWCENDDARAEAAAALLLAGQSMSGETVRFNSRRRR